MQKTLLRNTSRWTGPIFFSRKFCPRAIVCDILSLMTSRDTWPCAGKRLDQFKVGRCVPEKPAHVTMSSANQIHHLAYFGALATSRESSACRQIMALARQEYTLPARLFVPKASSDWITLCLVRSFPSQKLDHTPLFCQDLSCVTSGGTWRARGKRSHQHTLICFR